MKPSVANTSGWLILALLVTAVAGFMDFLRGNQFHDRLTALETQSAQAHSGVIENASVRPEGSIEIGGDR